MKVSIIVPVYGVECYIEKCLESLIHQDLGKNEYEVIVINDGTRDKSWEIVKRVTKGFSNFHLYEQENRGLSATRNLGFDLATGEYIWCVDSDDYIKDNCLRELYEKAKGKDLLIQTKYIPTGIDIEKRNQFDVKYNIKAKCGKDLLLSGFLSPAQFYWYKRDWLKKNGLKFYEGVYHEDMEFTPRALYLANTIAFQINPVYYFYKRPGSITTSFNPKRVTDVLTLSISLKMFYDEHKEEENAWYILIHACKCIVYGIIISKNLHNVDRMSYIKSIATHSILCNTLWTTKEKKYKLHCILLKLCPILYLRIFDKMYAMKYKE